MTKEQIGPLQLCLAVTCVFTTLAACGCGDQGSAANAGAGANPVRSATVKTARAHVSPGVAADARPAGVPNFHVVHPFLLRGAAPTPEGMRNLKALGVRTIFDLRAPTHLAKAEHKLAESLGMTYINLPMSAAAPSAREVHTFLADATNPAAQPVFVHCQYGADRTGTLIGIYRERYDRWPFNRTYKEMRRYGFKPFLTELKATVKASAPR